MRSMGRRESDASPMSVKLPGLRREQAGDHAHRRAGVAAIERMSGGRDAAADAGDLNAPSCQCGTFAPSASMQAQGRSAIGAGGEVGEARDAFSKGAEHGVAVTDGLVAGQAQAAVDIAGGADEAFLGGGGQAGSVRCWAV